MSEPIPSIEIPPELLPEDGRFGSGPSKVPPEAVRSLFYDNEDIFGRSHRSGVASEQVGRLTGGIRELLGVPDEYVVAIGNGGSSTFWEIAALGLVDYRSQHVIQGSFSEKWADVTGSVPHLERPHRISSPDPRVGTRPLFSEEVDADAYALTQNETSLGIKTEIARPSQEALVMVDATSSAGAMEVDITDTDAYFFSLQKAFASEGGLWVAILSPAAVERNQQVAQTSRYIPKVLDLGLAVDFSRRGQTYNTPPMTPIFLAARQTEHLLANGGLSAAAQRSQAMAETVYSWAEGSDYAEPYVLEPKDRSPTTPVVQLEGLDAATVAKVLDNNGIFDTAGYRGISGANMLRFATFPAIEPSDVEALLGCVDYVADRLLAS